MKWSNKEEDRRSYKGRRKEKGIKKDYKRISEASVKSYEFFLNFGGKKSE